MIYLVETIGPLEFVWLLVCAVGDLFTASSVNFYFNDGLCSFRRMK